MTTEISNELPVHVAFKGNNGLYLSARSMEGKEYLQFASTDVHDITAKNIKDTLSDQTIQMKSAYTKKYWRVETDTNWILADAEDITGDDTKFVEEQGNNFIALRNVGNNNYCGRKTEKGITDCLQASYPDTSTDETHLTPIDLDKVTMGMA